MALLELEGVGIRSPRGATAPPVLQDVTFAVEAGEFVVVVGAPRSGKTMLVSLLAGLIAPDRGVVRFDGALLSGPPLDRGIVVHNHTVLPWLTVFENLFLAVDAASPYLPVGLKRARAEYYLRLVKLRADARRLPRELAPAIWERLALARGWALDPSVLLLDDPFAAFEATTRAELQGELARLSALHRKTVVMTTSDPAEAIALADRVVVLAAHGSPTVRSTVDVALPRPRTPATRSLAEYARVHAAIESAVCARDAGAATDARKAG